MFRLSSLAICAALAIPALATAAPVTFTQLSGVVGGTPAATAVFKADLSGVGLSQIQSITIQDGSFGLGGAPGQFSGFDLDAIKLSTTDCTTAACAATASGLSVFDFVAGALFTPGAQRSPADPKLFGTGPSGNTINNLVATLAFFDGNSSTLTPNGFVSLGDGGRVTFNLTSPVSTAGLYLYIGEVGNNGEVAAGSITVSSSPVPEPGTLALVGLAMAAAAGWSRKRR